MRNRDFKNQLVEGIFTSKELCSMLNYNYDTFKRNKGRTLFLKLNGVCNIEKVGIGKGSRYIISNVTNAIVDVNIRKVRENKGRKEYKTMSDLFKAPIIQVLINKENGSHTGTFDNWLVYTSLVQKGFRKQHEKFLKDSKTLNGMEKDFFNVEGQSLHYNFVQALEKLRKSKHIVWYKVRMVVENEIDKDGNLTEVHRSIKNDEELSVLLDFENKFNKRYKIKDRNDLVYGNPKECIKRNTTLLKEYDRELRKEMSKLLGYKDTYTAYMIALKDNSKENKIKLNLEFCDCFDINLIKDDIYQYRLKKAELRQSKAKKQMTNGFGDNNIIVMLSETEVRRLQYEEKYVAEWLQLYKKYIHRYEK